MSVGSTAVYGSPDRTRGVQEKPMIKNDSQGGNEPEKKKPSRLAGLRSFSPGVYFVSLPGVAVNSFGFAIGLAARLAILGALAAAP